MHHKKLDLSLIFASALEILSVPSENSKVANLQDLKDTLNDRLNSIRTPTEDFIVWVDVDLGPVGMIKYPITKMGNGSTVDLFSVEDIMLFACYWRDRTNFTNFIDIGANIGLHSIVAARCGYRIFAFEPSPKTFELAVAISEQNSLEIHIPNSLSFSDAVKNSNLSLYVQAAISDKNGVSQLVQFMQNPYGNHLKGRKDNLYGDIEEINVELIAANLVAKRDSLIKIDAEGADSEILSSILNGRDQRLNSKIFLCDWRNETRGKLFKIAADQGLSFYNIFNPKFFLDLDALPKNHTADFVVLNV